MGQSVTEPPDPATQAEALMAEMIGAMYAKPSELLICEDTVTVTARLAPEPTKQRVSDNHGGGDVAYRRAPSRRSAGAWQPQRSSCWRRRGLWPPTCRGA
jgi:hypothetical protein